MLTITETTYQEHLQAAKRIVSMLTLIDDKKYEARSFRSQIDDLISEDHREMLFCKSQQLEDECDQIYRNAVQYTEQLVKLMRDVI